MSAEHRALTREDIARIYDVPAFLLGCTGLCENRDAPACFAADPEWQQAWLDYLDGERGDETRDEAYQRRTAARQRLCDIEEAYDCWRRAR